MAVYERTYRPYAGPWTDGMHRLLVIPRYAIQEAFRSRSFTVLYLGSLLPFLLGLIVLYLPHNVRVIQFLELEMEIVQQVVSNVFQVFMVAQTGFAFFIVLMLAPTLVAADLRNNAIPLDRSRPLSRARYLLGHFLTLARLLSINMWVAGLLLFAFQTALMGLGWAAAHWRIGVGIVVGSGLFLTAFSLLGLTISAWSRSKTMARGAFFAVFFFLGGLGEALNEILDTHWGYLLSIPDVTHSLYVGLMGLNEDVVRLSLETSILALLGYPVICAGLLFRQIRACEVVR